MSKYNGVSTKILKNGTKHIYVRFKHNGTNYGVKNFTKIFGCNSEKVAFIKLQEVKMLLSKGINPFDDKSLILNDLWDKKLSKATWRPNTKNHYINFYEIVLRNTLGKKPLNKITAKDVQSLKQKYANKSVSYQNRIKTLISPIMDEAVINGDIPHNPLIILRNEVAPSAMAVSDKVIENELVVAKKMYQLLANGGIKLDRTRLKNHIVYADDYEANNFLMLMLMTAHRFGELLQLRKSDIYNDKIISPKEITKTKRPYEFPLPIELKEYIDTKKDDELLFPNMTKGAVNGRFRKLVKSLDITLVKNHMIHAHDIRRIFTAILVKEKVDVALVDFALEHKVRGVMSHYLHYIYEDKKEVYEKYWQLVRSTIS